MDSKRLLEHMITLMREIQIIKSRIEPQDCGHMHTTVNFLESRVDEIKNQIGEFLK
jgi:hypothetical protein